jgi:hypothetical protein
MHEEPDGTHEICPVCNWEDDPVQAANPVLDGGANRVSLEEAGSNFAAFGAKALGAAKRVRRPLPDEYAT